MRLFILFFFFFQAEDGIRDKLVTGVQTCALPISIAAAAFIAIFAFHAPFPAIVIAAAIIGYFGGRFAPQYFAVGDGHRAAPGSFGPPPIDDDTPTPAPARLSLAELWGFAAAGGGNWVGAGGVVRAEV